MGGVVVVTTTLYNSIEELRFRLACDMVRVAVADGYKVVIGDDSSIIPEVAGTFRSLGANVYPRHHKGVGSGRREAFFHAWEVSVRENCSAIVWTEPEKVDLIRWVGKIIRPLENGEADIVIPARTERSWQTWPAFQRESETRANGVYNEVLGTRGFDPMFGPVAFTLDFVPEFAFCNPKALGVPDTYVQHYAPIIARHHGARVVSVEVDMTYPPEQRAEEEGAAKETMLEKRKWQLGSLSEAYRTLAKISPR
ncbi:MAG: hypothetical protein Q7R69_00230 [bacterium]|nr:hypothetical protein [bacterium]